MAFKYGDNLNFRTDIPLTTWVSGLFPKGQMGMLEDHIGVTIDSAKFQIPMSVAEKLFIEASELVKKEEKFPKKTVKKRKKVKDDGKSQT